MSPQATPKQMLTSNMLLLTITTLMALIGSGIIYIYQDFKVSTRLNEDRQNQVIERITDKVLKSEKDIVIIDNKLESHIHYTENK